MNDIDPKRDVNVRAESYCIASSAAVCAHCGARTRVVGLLVPPGHLTRTLHEDAPDEESRDEQSRDELSDDEESAARPDSWERASRPALLFEVEFVPEAVRRRIQSVAPAFRIAADAAAEGAHWGNHCERCGEIQHDHALFCEPDGAFAPLYPDQAGAIELVPVHESFEACAGGYALDPEFIRFDSGM